MASSVPAKTKPPKPKDKSWTISSFDAAIGVFSIVKDTIDIIPAKGVFGSVVVILGLIRVRRFVTPPTLFQALTSTNKTTGQDNQRRRSRWVSRRLYQHLRSPQDWGRGEGSRRLEQSGKEGDHGSRRVRLFYRARLSVNRNNGECL